MLSSRLILLKALLLKALLKSLLLKALLKALLLKALENINGRLTPRMDGIGISIQASRPDRLNAPPSAKQLVDVLGAVVHKDTPTLHIILHGMDGCARALNSLVHMAISRNAPRRINLSRRTLHRVGVVQEIRKLGERDAELKGDADRLTHGD